MQPLRRGGGHRKGEHVGMGGEGASSRRGLPSGAWGRGGEHQECLDLALVGETHTPPGRRAVCGVQAGRGVTRGPSPQVTAGSEAARGQAVARPPACPQKEPP